MSRSKTHSSNDIPTVIAVGVLAATATTLSHETLGHGFGCVGAGGYITLLTSIWFRCTEDFVTADAGGPLGNLAAGSAALALLSFTRTSPRMRLFLLMLGALNLFWLTGQLALESLTHCHDDWYFVSMKMSWSASWRVVGTAAGVCGYALVIRWVIALIRRQGGPDPHAIRLAYVASAASAVIAGLMWQPEPLRSAIQAFLAVGVAPLGLLRISRKANANTASQAGAGAVSRSWTWISGCLLFFALFLLEQATGLGSMAASALPP